ncbi:selenoprotein Pb-like [Spea bombifrons]|uniref:selenoprotein Pb-like n=1 Tax=Spea bombifrons TaxID=233779 RepID=UPI00234A9623|nr:selenoprotein Pb-like [Spea bombifrons]
MIMGAQALVITTLLGLLTSLASSAENETSICKPSPEWSIGDVVPMNGTLGQVTVVALLQASCGFCLVQAASMGPLREKLSSHGLTDITYMIVNDQSFYSELLYPELKRRAPAGVPVYQQIPNQKDVWEALNGDKDDFLIYDRCGRLAFHVRLPFSYLHFSYVEAAIRSTYFDDFCGNCSFYANVTEQTTNVSTASTTEPKLSPLPKDEKKEHHNKPHQHLDHEVVNKEKQKDHKPDHHLTGDEKPHSPNRRKPHHPRTEGNEY